MFSSTTVMYLVLRFRKKHGFNARETIPLGFEEKKAEAEARKNERELNLNYWFELKEKGAINEEEYEKKKKELV